MKQNVNMDNLKNRNKDNKISNTFRITIYLKNINIGIETPTNGKIYTSLG